MNDIDILRCFMEAMGTQYNVEREKQSLENLLKERQSDKEIIKDLDKNMFEFSNEVAKEYIPKSLIKEKIEELKERADEDNLDDFIRIQVLEELLNKNVK